jgi:adenosylcobinamide-GDP ribazoletransferase
MTMLRQVRRAGDELLTAIQFLTRVPVPAIAYEEDSLARAVKYFPLVGLAVGGSAGVLYLVLSPHLPRLVAGLAVVIYLVVVTGCFHEDGLADSADGFGGGWSREQVLVILKDSRIGSYGGAALVLSLGARVLLLGSMPPGRVVAYLVAAHVLCRWTTLPLSHFLPPAREETGQGARIARLTSRSALWIGTLISLGIVGLVLRWASVAPVVAAGAITLLSGMYYKKRIGGVTGDCFGATNQLAEIAVYVCGVWNA